MRTLDEARTCWPLLDQIASLDQLKSVVCSKEEPRITSTARSVCWKIFFLFNTLDRSAWLNALTDSRAAYDSLRSHFLRAIEHPDEMESAVDPLSENEESPWVALRKDETLRAEIFQDVERCMPDNMYFRQPSTQNMMIDILFIFCKLNPDIGYRQGMHEVLAPILWVVERDAIENRSVQIERNIATPGELIQDMFDNRFIEHDTFTLFGLVMQNAKFYYAPAEGGHSPSQPASSQNESPMLVRSRRIFEEYLPKADPGLSSHLIKIDIVPQIFLMRWIRLLFGREFPFDEVLTMWDIIFAEDPSLELVDLICVAMLLRIRWQLMEADTNTAFTLLLRYPEPPEPPHTFVHDALLLKQSLTPDVGSDIITKYGKKPPPVVNSTQNRGSSPLSNRAYSSFSSPKTLISQSSNLETMIQDAARGVYSRGEKWGVARAVRGAVGEVRKNVQALQSGPSTPRSGGREYRKPARVVPAGKSTLATSDVLRRISALEARNKSLAKMLESALSELWDCHKERSDQEETDKESMEALSIAIAKVQFIQVYLEDFTIPLPMEETMAGKKPTAAIPPPERTSSAPPSTKATTNPVLGTDYPNADTPTGLKSGSNISSLNKAVQGTEIPSPSADRESVVTSLSVPTVVAPSPSNPSASPSRARPPLAQSSFSWMLGQDERTSAFASASVHTAFPSDEKRRQARGRDALGGKGYLFGEEDDEGSSARDGRLKGKATKAEKNVEEEVIDLGPLGKSAVA